MKKIITSLCHVSLCGLILLSFGCANTSSSLVAHAPTNAQAGYKNKPQKNVALSPNQAPMRTIASSYVDPKATASKKSTGKQAIIVASKAPTKAVEQKKTPNAIAVSAQKTQAPLPSAKKSNVATHNLDPKLIAKARIALPQQKIVAENKSTKGAVVIPKAKSVLGVRYVYGGTTTRGFDCSGFVQWVYKHAGVKLPRTARDQSRTGVAVKRNNMKVGDIVAFRHPRIGYHTGIYIGNNKFIHSPRRNKSIQVSDLAVSYFRRNYIGARRVAELGVAEKNAADNLLSQYSGKKLKKD